ncbi:hypothetical protein LZ30DRAFT_806185 [Colletotrichum cereale]|nr:hypothetical protein LZ30DRAFT_806185 [Colletotrichum cereale]
MNVVSFLIKEEGFDVNDVSSSGRSPLKSAWSHVAVEIVAMFLENGPDPTVTGNPGRMPMHAASQNGHTEVVRLQLRKTQNSSTFLLLQAWS